MSYEREMPSKAGRNGDVMLQGTEVTLEEMLRCREQRAQIQQELLAVHHCPLISFSLNIPGPVKTTPALERLFSEGVHRIETALAGNHLEINEQRNIHAATGDACFLSVTGDAVRLKALMVEIEETHPLGRIFDMDVLDANGNKLSRPTYRKCLLCDRQAQDCARSRRHSVSELQEKIEDLLMEFGYEL